MSYRNALGAVVAVLREAAGLTQKDLQAQTPLPQWRFSKLERGQGSDDQRLATLAVLSPLVGRPLDVVVAMAEQIVAAAGGQDPDYGEALRMARLVVEGRLVAAPAAVALPPSGPGVPPLSALIEQRLADALGEVPLAEHAGRTVAQLANALENYERALYLRAQRAALQAERT